VEITEPIVLATVAWLLMVVSNWWRERTSGPDPRSPDGIRAAYRRGEIDERELERRLDVAMDPEADRIRATVEQVSGIAESTSWMIAAEFRSLKELREADREDLEAIPNVGEQRAAAIEEL
jgi:hypothetical protein